MRNGNSCQAKQLSLSLSLSETLRNLRSSLLIVLSRQRLYVGQACFCVFVCVPTASAGLCACPVVHVYVNVRLYICVCPLKGGLCLFVSKMQKLFYAFDLGYIDPSRAYMQYLNYSIL